MSAKEENADGNERPNLRLSRRSLVAAGTLAAALLPFGAKKAGAQIFPLFPDRTCAIPENQTDVMCQCFLSGTHIQAPGGEAAIEDLRIGDLIATEGGEDRAIRWIGRITVDRRGDAPWHADAMPVRVAKDAFGKGSPHRDLYLSRAHMVYLNGVLIPIGDLINGRTIAAVNVEGDQLVYYHVVLETHDVVIAEGAPCESLLTTVDKLSVFDNLAEYYALYGTPAKMAPYAPLAAFNGGRSAIKSRLYSAVSPVIDFRHPRDVARDRLEARAFESSRAA